LHVTYWKGNLGFVFLRVGGIGEKLLVLGHYNHWHPLVGCSNQLTQPCRNGPPEGRSKAACVCRAVLLEGPPKKANCPVGVLKDNNISRMADHALCFLPMVSFYVIFGNAKCSRNSMTRYCKESRKSELTMKI